MAASLLRQRRTVQLPDWAAAGAAGIAAATAVEQAVAAGCRRSSASSSRQGTVAGQAGFSRAAATCASSAWAETAKLEGIVLHARGYYQGRQPKPPPAADLVALVVAVSRLVQAEFGAVQGRGECNLRDQVLRLLTELLGVRGQGRIVAEAPMGPGRADLVLLGLAGPPLLVVEYKLLASGLARTRREHHAAQLTRYLSVKAAGCGEGLLVTFDAALPNGLSAARVVAVDPGAWARLMGERPEHAPPFTVQPCEHLDAAPWALGAMAGICAQHGVALQEEGEEQGGWQRWPWGG